MLSKHWFQEFGFLGNRIDGTNMITERKKERKKKKMEGKEKKEKKRCEVAKERNAR